MVSRSEWIQLNIALCRRQGSALAGARGLFGHIQPLVEDWRARGALACFYFMRKAPDVRLRFRVTSGRARTRLKSQLAVVTNQLIQARHVRHAYFGVYEPEQFRFGGSEAMELAHRHFFIDSLSWMALDQAACEQKRQCDNETLVLATLNDLFTCALDDAAEVWDTWCRYAANMEATPVADAPAAPAVDLETVFAHCSSVERTIIRRYRRQHLALAKGLHRLASRGRLSCGVRAFLLHLAVFQFHRHGIAGPRQAALTRQIVAAWSPHSHLGAAES